MARGKSAQDTSMLSMALVGYEMEKQKIEAQIQAIRARLGTGASAGNKAGEPAKRRTLSVAARKRIAAAQRKRWAEHRKNVAQAAKAK